jgi:hypothetical protein
MDSVAGLCPIAHREQANTMKKWAEMRGPRAP